MPLLKLIADSGSTKTDWCLLNGRNKTFFTTQGLSPYFFNEQQITEIINKELKSKLGKIIIQEIYFYGTGCSSEKHINIIRVALVNSFGKIKIFITHDLMAAARALCGEEKGIACILGTGSNSCYYNGKKIVKNSPGIGFILGDEGSGAYLGKRIIQYYLYKTFDQELMEKFRVKFQTSSADILQKVYKESLPNRFLASFTSFLSENRGHYMIENILEDCLNDFFFNHLYKYSESWSLPIHFVGGIAYTFSDVLKELCLSYELTSGRILKAPIEGLIKYHADK